MEEDIQTLEDLERASGLPNPVNIAGYGRESTHKGYLSWILNSSRWNRAGDALLALCHTSTQVRQDVEVRDLETMWEQKFGSAHRKIDLLSCFKNGSEPFFLPIEIKTDAGPSGEDQLEQLSKGQVEGTKRLGPLLLRLGAACVQDFNCGEFFPLGPNMILGRLCEKHII